MKILNISCLLVIYIITSSCSQTRFKYPIFLESIPYENVDVGEPLDSILLPLVTVKDSVLENYISQYLNDNLDCLDDTFRTGIVVYSIGSSDIAIGRSRATKWMRHYKNQAAIMMNGAIITIRMHLKLTQHFFTPTNDSITIRNLYSEEQQCKLRPIFSTEDGYSQWVFRLEDNKLIPQEISIESKCAKTKPDEFPPGTKIILIGHIEDTL